METNLYVCECGKSYLRDDKYAKYNYWLRCDCGQRAVLEYFPHRTIMTKFGEKK